MNLGRNVGIKRLKSFQSAAQTTVTSTEVDVSDYEGALFLVSMGEITSGAATTCYVRSAAATGMGSAAELDGTLLTIADDDDDLIQVMDVYRPLEPFLDVIVTRATQNSEVESISVLLYGPRKAPTTHDSGTVADMTVVAGPDDA